MLGCLARGEASFLANGYSVYVRIASTFLHGGGLCVTPGVQCALREPAYPLMLSPFVAADWLYPGVPVVQSAIGAGLVWLAWKIGASLFDQRTGLLAAGMTAFSPYAVVHDTALQDTVLVNSLIALAVYFLLRSRPPDPASPAWPGAGGTGGAGLGAGLALGLAVLTTARIAFLLPCTLAWAAVATRGSWRVRVSHTAVVALPVLLLAGGWAARNWRAVGAPVLTTEAGESLWVANNDWTFSHFPIRSIDASVAESYARLSASERAELDQFRDDDVARDRVLARWAVEYGRRHPLATVGNGLRKVWTALSAQLTPARSPVVQVAYALVYAPIHLLAAVGLWRSRDAWRTHALVYLLFLSFVFTTAIFWAHTSHKSYLDVFLFVYAASVLDAVLIQRQSARSDRQQHER